MKSLYILFATNDEENIAPLRLMVQYYGWTAEFVTTATQMINAVNINSHTGPPFFDAIVSSISYTTKDNDPLLTGVTAGKLIRKIRPNIPILFVSKNNNSILREEVRRVRDAKLLQRPRELSELFENIKQLVEWHNLAEVESYKGLNRRVSSINRSGKFRRATDRVVTVPERLEQVIASAAKGGH